MFSSTCSSCNSHFIESSFYASATKCEDGRGRTLAPSCKSRRAARHCAECGAGERIADSKTARVAEERISAAVTPSVVRR